MTRSRPHLTSISERVDTVSTTHARLEQKAESGAVHIIMDVMMVEMTKEMLFSLPSHARN